MEKDELRWLGSQAVEHKLIVEIGSFAGRSTKMLAQTPGVLYSVDNLQGEPNRPDSALDDHFRENMASEIANGKIKLLRMTSLEAADWWEENVPRSPDMVFIDGDHEYPAPRQDIVAWSSLLAEGGLLCGHDKNLVGVARSLYELDVKTEGVVGSIWAV